MGDLILTILHHLAVFAIAILLGAEFALLRGGVSARAIPLLARLDAGYGGAAALVVLAGIGRIFHGGAAHYLANPAFWAKMALFLAVGVLSVPATIAFIRWNRALKADGAFLPPPAEVGKLRRLLHVELALLLCIPVAAAVMARGGL
jgi:putative membrane protein